MNAVTAGIFRRQLRFFLLQKGFSLFFLGTLFYVRNKFPVLSVLYVLTNAWKQSTIKYIKI